MLSPLPKLGVIWKAEGLLDGSLWSEGEARDKLRSWTAGAGRMGTGRTSFAGELSNWPPGPKLRFSTGFSAGTGSTTCTVGGIIEKPEMLLDSKGTVGVGGAGYDSVATSTGGACSSIIVPAVTVSVVMSNRLVRRRRRLRLLRRRKYFWA